MGYVLFMRYVPPNEVETCIGEFLCVNFAEEPQLGQHEDIEKNHPASDCVCLLVTNHGKAIQQPSSPPPGAHKKSHEPGMALCLGQPRWSCLGGPFCNEQDCDQ